MVELHQRLSKAKEIIHALEAELREADRGLIALTTELEARAMALEESEARFRLMVEGSEEVFFFSHDDAGRFTYLSPSIQQVLGYTPQMLIGEPFGVLLTEDPANDTVEAATADALASGERSDAYTAIVRHQSGREVCLEIVEQPVVGVEGRAAMQGFARDVTERKRRQDALRETTRVMNALIEASPAAIYVLDREGRVELWNPAAEQLFGWPAVEILGRELPSPVDGTGSELHAVMRESLEGRPFSALDLRSLRKDGTPVDINVSTAPLHTATSEIDGVVAVIVDVHEKREAERALVRSEEHYRMLFEEDLTGDFIMTPRGDLLDCNKSFAKIFGYASVDHALSEGILPIYSDPGQLEDFLSVIRERGQARAMEGEYRRLDGAPVFVIGSAYGIFDEEGGLAEVRGHILDVTEKRLLEEQLLRAQKMEAVGRLAGGVAHDFNNLLTAITGHADFALDHVPEGNPAREEVEEVRRNADRAAALTGQLLAFSRQQVVQPAVLDLAREVREVEKMLRRIIGEDVELETRLNEGRVKMDPSQLQQVIVNLAVNARDAMPDGGRVTMNVGPVVVAEGAVGGLPGGSGDYMLLSVTDTGHGMDAATQQHIFEPFFTTKDPGKGTGLGLATVYGIVTSAGGSIDVTSEPGAGTTLDVYLPRVDEAVAPEEGQVGEPRLASSSANATVLVVEDEESVRRLVTRILQRQGYEVLHAPGPVEALGLCQEELSKVELLLTDVVMPDMTGHELAISLKAIQPEMIVMFMSGYTQDEVVRRGVAEEDFLFIEKPFTPAALVRKVEAALAGRGA